MSRKSEAKLHIAVDADDVVIDFTRRYLEAMRVEFNVSIDVEDITTWDNNPMKTFPWKDYGYKSWWEWLRERDWIWATSPAVPGAIAGLHALRADGYWVELVTSKPEWAENGLWKWLANWRPTLDAVIIADPETPKHLISAADVLVDDKPENVEHWVKSDPTRIAIIFDQPWNRDMEKNDNIFRAYNWEEVRRIINLHEEIAAI